MFNSSEHYISLDEGSDPKCKGADFVEQDGLIYCWSESNIDYEMAFWLYASGLSAQEDHLRKTRWPNLTKASDDAKSRLVYDRGTGNKALGTS